MQKVYGSPKRQDGLYQIGLNTYELIYGFGKEQESDETGWNWRKTFKYLPTLAEIKTTIEDTINANTAETILQGFTWNGKPVWLSIENQLNLQRAYNHARDTSGANLPKRFKLGEDAEGKPVYHTFTAVSAFADFINKMDNHIDTATNNGYNEKDAVDYSKFNPQ